jgi:hypothetical protein
MDITQVQDFIDSIIAEHPIADTTKGGIVGGILCGVIFGSHLYGTDTPDSDIDIKVLYIPTVESLILGKGNSVFKLKFQADGEEILKGSGHHKSQPNEIEAEFIPFQVFLSDLVRGQTYALETFFGIQNNMFTDPELMDHPSEQVRRDKLKQGLSKFFNEYSRPSNISGMVGFAKKQTLDYVTRGKRLTTYRAVHKLLEDTPIKIEGIKTRVKHFIDLHSTELLSLYGVSLLESGDLLLCGRQILSTSPWFDFRNHVQSYIDTYGSRSKSAAEFEVDPKSLAHAIRCYKQVQEFLDKGCIQLPRPSDEVSELKRIRAGDFDPETIKTQLEELDSQVKLSTEAVKKTETQIDKLKLETEICRILKTFLTLNN